MKIKVGEEYMFTKSGNRVKVIAVINKDLYRVERTDTGKGMVVTAEGLAYVD